MADQEIQIPFGPDRTNGAGIEPIPAIPAESEDASSAPVVEPMNVEFDKSGGAGDEYHAGGLTDEEATAQGMDPMQMSILALKDSIGQGRELKARERDREELAEALAADHEELADRRDILTNYQAIVAEQDAIINGSTQRREEQKAELSQVTIDLDETENALARMKEYHASQLQPIESDLGRVRASADQAKNDERSRKAELSASEKELSRADDSDANTMAIARHQQTQAAYEEARRRSEQTREQLAEIERVYNDACSQADQAEEPLERRVSDLKAREVELKESINRLNDDISAARKRRQYCDNVFQYPEETEQMHREVMAAEAAARQMDADNEVLREQLAQSKKLALRAKIAIGIVIAIIIVIIVAFIVVTNR